MGSAVERNPIRLPIRVMGCRLVTRATMAVEFCDVGSTDRRGARMREVRIVKERSEKRCWLAKDVNSGEVVLRLRERPLLLRIAKSLEWEVVSVAPEYDEWL
jgi:hypothetical protein